MFMVKSTDSGRTKMSIDFCVHGNHWTGLCRACEIDILYRNY